MSRIIGRRGAAAAVVLAALAAAFVAVRADAKGDPRTYPIKSKVFGRTFKDWANEWWQWDFSIPVSVNPVNDTTGERASVGQHGPVWFLAGYGASSALTRTVKIPAKKALFFPVINVIYYNFENDSAPGTLAQMQTFVTDYMAAIDPTSLHVVLDDTEIQGVAKMRVPSSFDDLTAPTDNISAPGTPGGANGPGISDGFWCMLRPLSVGRHSLRIQGTVKPPYAFTLDITYDVTVVDHAFPPAGN